MLASLSRSVLAGDRALPSLLEQIREAFGLRAVTMVERTADGERTVGSCGAPSGERPDEIAVTDTLALRLCGRTLPASERRVLVAFAEQAAVALQQGRLAAQAAEAERLAAGNSMRTALLAAVSHDLRTPLAGIKAAVVGAAVDRPGAHRRGPRRAGGHRRRVRRPAHRAGRQPAGHEPAAVRGGQPRSAAPPTSPPWCAPGCPGWTTASGRGCGLDSPDDLPPVLADPGLLERVVANLVGNAIRHAPAGPVDVPQRRGRRPGRAARRRPRPGCRRGATGNGCSPRSSGSGTHRPGRASGSGWPSPAG